MNKYKVYIVMQYQNDEEPYIQAIYVSPELAKKHLDTVEMESGECRILVRNVEDNVSSFWFE